jgi:hypothetical protein
MHEQFAVNLQVLTLRNIHLFESGDVPIGEARSMKCIAPEGSEPTGTGRQSVASSKAAEVGLVAAVALPPPVPLKSDFGRPSTAVALRGS